MSRGRPALPGATSLFRGPEAPSEAAPDRRVVNQKVTLYMPPDLLADLDEVGVALRRNGVTVDRSRMIRDAIRMVLLDDRTEFVATLNREESA